MIDNLDLILPLLRWDDENDNMYVLQLMQRKKEHPGLPASGRVVKDYFINNEEYLLERYNEIKELCDYFQARAMLRLNARSLKGVALQSLQELTKRIVAADYERAYKAYIHAANMSSSKYKKRWIIDIDNCSPQSNKVVSVWTYLNTLPSGHEEVVVGRIPSKTGVHLITEAFDAREFRERYPHIDIHKDNPTNLYIPDE